jgi:NDP-sugar pyrophosphorylase family protein
MCVRVLENLEEAGVDEVHAAVDYRATDFKGSIKRHYIGMDDRKIDVHFHEPSAKKGWKEGDVEPEFRGIADAVRWLSNELTGVDNFIIASGDHVHNLPLGEAVDKHKWYQKNYGTQVTIIGYRKPKEEIVQRFGHFKHDSNGVITRFS